MREDGASDEIRSVRQTASVPENSPAFGQADRITVTVMYAAAFKLNVLARVELHALPAAFINLRIADGKTGTVFCDDTVDTTAE